MSEEQSAGLYLANLANKVVSEGGANAKAITKRIVNSGDVVGYELESGEHITVEQAIEMAKANELKHVGVSTSKDGSEYIRSLADRDESNNLGNLPSISSDNLQ